MLIIYDGIIFTLKWIKYLRYDKVKRICILLFKIEQYCQEFSKTNQCIILVVCIT